MAVSQAIDNKSGVNEWPAGNGGGEPKALRRQVCRSWGQTELEGEGGGEVRDSLWSWEDTEKSCGKSTGGESVLLEVE